MKKIGITLAVALLLSLFPPCAGSAVALQAQESPQGYIVALKGAQDGAVLLEDTGLEKLGGQAGLYHADSLAEIKALGSLVDYYEPDCTATLFDLPNDTYAHQQWSLENLEISYAWDKGYDGAGVRIAVIDSGVNSLHEDFEGTSFDKGYNEINGSHDVTDELGHGTFVCGVLGAAMNNGKGVAGLCPRATIVPIKCFGSDLETNASYVIAAIYDAVDDYDCDVINLSLGITMSMESMREAVEYAANQGVIIVSAVGNSGTAQMNYPAAYDCVIGVGAIMSSGQVAGFSEKNSSVYVVAPGMSLAGLKHTAVNAYIFDGVGTSYSTPHVAAAAAILKQYAPSANYSDFATLLRKSAIDAGPSGYDTAYGYGRLDMKSFVQAMESYTFANVGERFPDVSGHWAEQSIQYCVNNQLFTGVSADSFQPDVSMTRAMFVTVLSRMSGENISGFPVTFSDVPAGEWYAQPSGWGFATGIVTGAGDGLFLPAQNLTREQLAVFLYRYALLYKLDDGKVSLSSLSGYTDNGKISSWAKEAMAWAVSEGLITGRSAKTLSPQDIAKRCEVATVITRFLNGKSA